ncbi:hypothetical protein EVAR_89580_1 [Eumeta japonica]|uniref:Uncharacterized protein n=1 Tax=Eumeta variegata TaxID=151549 RepID=A0A4C1SFK9_EUMVA|nr:hypothetical protein EVAR_89580_1 [Eumeta japonica]
MNSSVRPGPKSRIRQDRDRGRDRRRARGESVSVNTKIEDNKRLTILLDKNFGIYSRGGTTEDTGHTHAALAHWPIFILKYQRQRFQRAPFGSARREAAAGARSVLTSAPRGHGSRKISYCAIDRIKNTL